MLSCPECGERKNVEVKRYVDGTGKAHLRLTCRVIVHEVPVVVDMPDPELPDAAEPIAPSHRVLLIRPSRKYRPGMSAAALYEVTRQWWKLGPRREHVDYAFAVIAGVVEACWQVDGWEEATDSAPGTIPLGSRDAAMEHRYVGVDVSTYFPRGAQSPVRYVNVPEL